MRKGRGRGIGKEDRAKIPAEIPIDFRMFKYCCLQRDADESDQRRESRGLKRVENKWVEDYILDACMSSSRPICCRSPFHHVVVDVEKGAKAW